MKVLQVTAVDFTLKKFLLPLIDEMDAQGYEVHTACYTGEISDELRNKGYIIHHIPFTRNTNIFNHLKSIGELVRLIKTENYKIIHTHTPMASLVARIAGKIARVPVIAYTAHGFYFHENMKPFVYKAAFQLEKIWGKFFTDYLFFQSIEDYQLAKKYHFQKEDRLVHISNGVSPSIFDPLRFNREIERENLGLAEEDIAIAFVGRLVREKGITELLDAYRSIRQQGYKNVKLLIVGGKVSGDRDSLDVKTLIKDFPKEIQSDILLLGLRNDIPNILAAADIFSLPSYREGLPRSIIEAMAMGKPIVATNIRGCREEVTTGVNGYLCESKNSKDLEGKLLNLVESKEKIKEFGSNSRQIFLEQFNEQVVLDKQLEVFNKAKKELEYV